MFNEMPKNGTPIESAEDLPSDEIIDKMRKQNEQALLSIELATNKKILDDTEALRDNAKIVNTLGKFLVWIFFGSYEIKKINKKIYFILFWIIVYVCLNVYLYGHFDDKEVSKFYIGLINNIGLFLIVCILGKFLKDSISNIIEIFKK